ncbi:MAG: hypothetical protein ACRD0P_23455 [Stackebrandtia sp.]
MPDITLDMTDAAELTELLQFLRDWVAADHHELEESLTRFVGGRGYHLGQLHGDLDRFTFLLHSNDGEALFEPGH